MGEGSETGARLAELLAALSLGIDLGFGQPMEHVLRQCRIAMRLCELAGAGEGTRAAAYSAGLMRVSVRSELTATSTTSSAVSGCRWL